MLKLPPGFNGKIVNPGGVLRAVVIQGELTHSEAEKSKVLKPGSYFESNGAYKHIISAAQSNQETIIYLRSSGNYKLIH